MRFCFILIMGMLVSVWPVSAALFGGSEAYLEKEEGARGLGRFFRGLRIRRRHNGVQLSRRWMRKNIGRRSES